VLRLRHLLFVIYFRSISFEQAYVYFIYCILWTNGNGEVLVRPYSYIFNLEQKYSNKECLKLFISGYLGHNTIQESEGENLFFFAFSMKLIYVF
jgi:hypothetical protein